MGAFWPTRKLARRPTFLSLHLAAFRRTPGLSFAEQKGHPFMHMQEDKFRSQPPALEEPRTARYESPALGGGRKARTADWRATQPLASRAPQAGIALLKSLPQAATAAAAGGGEFI